MYQTETFGFGWRKNLALDQVGLRTYQAQVARHLGHTAGAGQQAQCHLGQTELDFAVVYGDAVVAHQRHLPATAQCCAVDQRHHRLAQRLDGAEVLLQAFDLGIDGGGVAGLEAHGRFEVGTRKKGGFGRGQQDAGDGILVLEHLLSQDRYVFLPLQAHGVDGGVWLVKGYGGYAVGQGILDGFHGVPNQLRIEQRSLCETLGVSRNAIKKIATRSINTRARGQFLLDD